jgi:hypothetical protein
VTPPAEACKTLAECAPLQVLDGKVTALGASEKEHHEDTVKRLDAQQKSIDSLSGLEGRIYRYGLGIMIPAWLSLLGTILMLALRKGP